MEPAGDLNLNQTSHRWIIRGTGSSGDNATVIDASQLQDRVFQIVNPATQVVFQDLVIQGGLAQDDGTDGAQAGTTNALGGGILNNGGEVTLENVAVQNNGARGGDAAVRRAYGYSARGGGIYSTGGALTVAGATVANNQATGGRGGDSSRTIYRAGDGGSASGAFFEQGITAVTQLVIHEYGHQYSGDHLSEEYHEGLCRLGARLLQAALDKPEAFQRWR
jgi:hypothetical protein